MEKISAVLIVKNEQKVIERCLRSVKDFDEVVVLDTGSTDRTMEIAREMGAKVSSMPPEKPFHFAKARNAAHDIATNDWCMAIDADEVLRSGMLGKIRKAMREQEAREPFHPEGRPSHPDRPYRGDLDILPGLKAGVCAASMDQEPRTC